MNSGLEKKGVHKRWGGAADSLQANFSVATAAYVTDHRRHDVSTQEGYIVIGIALRDNLYEIPILLVPHPSRKLMR
jgi:hypothetical protein